MSRLTVSTYEMPGASLGKNNPLPDLKHVADPHQKIAIDETTVSAEESRYMGWGQVSTILPYTMQDQYDRKLRSRAFKSFVLENEHLRATFLPELGGRLWSLVDKDAGRELLHVNPVFRPCNLGLRNAWISGGVEWNCGIVGHTPFTVDDMACEALTLSDGTPVVRMYQYERVRHLLYRVEVLLPDGAKELYVRVRIDNATAEDTAVYWWSNMAVDERPDVRVIVPAEKAFHYGYGAKLSKVPVPYLHLAAEGLRGAEARKARENGGFADWDASRPMTLPHSMDFFFDVPKKTRPFIAAVDKGGYGMCQTSTGELHGRKLFVWGMGTGGRHWQEFLSQPGSAYIELQSGLTHTQLEHLPMKGLETISWVEAYGAVQADAALAQGKDWDAAIASVTDKLQKRSPEGTLEKIHEMVKTELDGKRGKVLHRGMGFAWCEKALLGEDFHTCGLSLAAMRKGVEEQPFLALAETGVLPCPDPLAEPKSYAVGARWEAALRDSIAERKSDNWFGHYQLGVMLAARGADEEAMACFERSLEKAENPWALRCVAVLDARAGRKAQAADALLKAVELKPIRSLAIEALDALAQAGRCEDILRVIGELPRSVQAVGRVKTWEIYALIGLGRYDEAMKMLNSRIVLTDVREGEVQLSELWFRVMAIREKGDDTAENLAWAKENLTPPKHLDFRMA